MQVAGKAEGRVEAGSLVVLLVVAVEQLEVDCIGVEPHMAVLVNRIVAMALEQERSLVQLAA